MTLGKDPRLSVVIATRDRATELASTLERLAALPEAPQVVVVDNASGDDTAGVARRAPGVRLLGLPRNLGAAARTVGVHHAGTPYVAFSDDDSWWAPGALARAADTLDAQPAIALVAGLVLVGTHERVDPTSRAMGHSPLPSPPGVPGCAVLGFLACAAVVRRAAYLDVGGFHPRLGIGGEEQLLATDLRARGHLVQYVPAVVAHHHPSPRRDPGGRRRILARNALWTAWLRRPLPTALRATRRVLHSARSDPHARRGVRQAVTGAGWVLRERRVVDAGLEADLRRLEG